MFRQRPPFILYFPAKDLLCIVCTINIFMQVQTSNANDIETKRNEPCLFQNFEVKRTQLIQELKKIEAK
jgi:hypothetical protein